MKGGQILNLQEELICVPLQLTKPKPSPVLRRILVYQMTPEKSYSSNAIRDININVYSA